MRSLGYGQRAALITWDSQALLNLFYHCWRSGAVFTPISPRLAPEEIDAILLDTGATLLTADEIERVPHELTAGLYSPYDDAALLFTSGTTGRPRGVRITRWMIQENARNTTEVWGLTAHDVTVSYLHLSHAGALHGLATPLLEAGGKVILHDRFEPLRVLEDIERHKATVLFGVPLTYLRLAEHPAFGRTELTSLRWAVSGGAPLSRRVFDAWWDRGVALKEGFGMTEAGVNLFTISIDEARRKPGSIGRPFPMHEVKVAADGELLLRGPHVSPGYLNEREPILDQDGWFHTGDLVEVDEEGLFRIIGRKKLMFVSGGINVFPAEVELALLAHPGVHEACVLPVEDPRWGEAGCAYVAADPGVGEAELRRFLALRLAAYKTPKSFHFLPSLPQTSIGKVDRRALRP